jgi:orotidine-5'-phosphate decarboxylase
MMYAEAFFKTLNFDAVTVPPYMGVDSVSPFLPYEGKWVILLALTSNPSSRDFEFLETDGQPLFEKVLQTASTWAADDKLMFVVGATHPDMFKRIREIVPNHFLLVPGIGAQGGSLEDVCKYGLNKDCGLIVNSSRDIIYASSGKDFAEKARERAMAVQKQMSALLDS